MGRSDGRDRVMAARKPPSRGSRKAFGLLPGSEVVNQTLPPPPVLPRFTADSNKAASQYLP